MIRTRNHDTLLTHFLFLVDVRISRLQWHFANNTMKGKFYIGTYFQALALSYLSGSFSCRRRPRQGSGSALRILLTRANKEETNDRATRHSVKIIYNIGSETMIYQFKIE